MRRLARFIFRIFVIVALLVGVLFLVGPYEDSDLSASFDASELSDGVDAYFERTEATFDDIREGQQKQVIWNGATEAKTPLSVLYLHGFSASLQEIRPVPDRVAQALGANLVFTRLKGHGRDGAAMGEATVAAWMADVAEALAVARTVGDRVLILSTSTGGTLAAAAAVDPALSEDVAGVVFVSPNFGVNNPAAPLMTFPAARYWLPLLVGEERAFEALNAAQAEGWTTRYPSVSLLPMAALVEAVVALDLEEAAAPALFYYAEQDQVVRADATAAVAARWGGTVKTVNPQLGPDDDPFAHVIAGDILSPGQTESAVQTILEWARGL